MRKLKNLSAIDTNTVEGRYLIAALSKLTTESQRDKEPDEVLEQCHLLQEQIYADALPIPEPQERPTFQKALEGVINSYSMERAGANTPDFLLAEYLTACLTAYAKAVNARERWYHKEVAKQ